MNDESQEDDQGREQHEKFTVGYKHFGAGDDRSDINNCSGRYKYRIFAATPYRICDTTGCDSDA
jgi:hypothetical protein